MTEEEGPFEEGEIPNEEEEEPFEEGEFANEEEGEFEEEEETNFSIPPEFLNNVDENASKRNGINNIIRTFNCYVPDIEVKFSAADNISFSLPSSFLPVTLRVAYNFINCETLLDVSFELTDFEWNVKPQFLNISNPDNHNFCGKSLVYKATDKFFSPKFQPKTNYRSCPIFLTAGGHIDKSTVDNLVQLGFTRIQSERAASICHNNIDKSLTFLQTGQYNQDSPFKIFVSYRDCPLLYLILEIFDAILDLQDHCSICGEYTVPGLKPSICKNNQLCQYKFMELGLGTSLVKEIQRDPFVADLLFSAFACAAESQFFDPKPPNPKTKTLQQIISKMPSMKKISRYQQDSDLVMAIGNESVDILRWVILTCRSNFFSLPNKLEFPQFRKTSANDNDFRCFQFMALTASPEQENVFQQLKAKYGSRFLWHGSSADRWHSIIRQGLKNGTGTNLQQNGAALGSGIYFAPDSSTSISYCRASENKYYNSALCNNLQIIALCEVVNLPVNQTVSHTVEIDSNDPKNKRTKTVKGCLNDCGWAFTLTLEEACIVRFLFVNLVSSVNVSQNPPRNIPTLNQVLKLRANIA